MGSMRRVLRVGEHGEQSGSDSRPGRGAMMRLATFHARCHDAKRFRMLFLVAARKGNETKTKLAGRMLVIAAEAVAEALADLVEEVEPCRA